MNDFERDDLVVDVADALTLQQEVQWDRCERLATPANRWVLENLRAFSGVLAGGRSGGGDAWPGGAASTSEPYARGLARLAVRALIAFAALEVAAALILAAWGWTDLRRQHGDLAVFLAILLVGHAATACLFLFGGRRDRRTWLLGVYFLLKATLVNPFMLLEFVRGMPPADPFGYPDFARPYVYPFLFAPACLWAFARECPRVHRWTRLDELARRMVRVSAAVGCLAWVGSVAWVELARAGRVDPAVFWVGFDASLAVMDLLALAAVAVVALRAYGAARRGEARRAVLLRVPDVSGGGGGVRRGRDVLARGLALQLSLVSGRRVAQPAAELAGERGGRAGCRWWRSIDLAGNPALTGPCSLGGMLR